MRKSWSRARKPVATEQLIQEYLDGAGLDDLAKTYQFKSANSVYARLSRAGFTAWRRNFGNSSQENSACQSLPIAA